MTVFHHLDANGREALGSSPGITPRVAASLWHQAVPQRTKVFCVISFLSLRFLRLCLMLSLFSSLSLVTYAWTSLKTVTRPHKHLHSFNQYTEQLHRYAAIQLLYFVFVPFHPKRYWKLPKEGATCPSPYWVWGQGWAHTRYSTGHSKRRQCFAYNLTATKASKTTRKWAWTMVILMLLKGNWHWFRIY